jgi:L-lactate dehydrogenase complex protein LldG
MATREEFFASLAPTSVEPTPMPDLPQGRIDAPPRERFEQVLAAVGGTLGHAPRSVTRLASVQARVDELVGQGCQVLSLVAGVSGNRDPAAVTDPHQLANIDYTVARGRLAVAENGAIWISGEDLVTRNAVFICEHLIAVVEEDRIVGTLDEAMARIGPLAGGWGVFISGPSKTADIEQALVLGAHGARSLTVYLVEREPG